MPHCIFDEWLKQQARDQSLQCHRQEIHFHDQAVLKSDSLNVEIEVDQLDFAVERNLLRFPSRQSLAQELTEVGQHRVSFFDSMLPHQDDDCVERVEEEMRVKLHLQRAQLCLGELTFELSGAQLELRRLSSPLHELAVVADAVLNADD